MQTRKWTRANPTRRGGVKRAIVLWGLAAGAALVTGKQIGQLLNHRTENPVNIPRAEQTESLARNELMPRRESVSERIPSNQGKHEIIIPEFMHEALEKDMYQGSSKKIQQNWEKIAQKGRIFFNARKKETGKVYHSLPIEQVNEICTHVNQKTGVPAALIKAIFNQESKFDPLATAPDGGMGAGQLMPIVLLDLYLRGHTIRNPYDPIENLTGAAFHFKNYYNQAQKKEYSMHGSPVAFGQLPTRVQYMIVLRMYNAGPGKTFVKEIKREGRYEVELIIFHKYPKEVIELFEQYQRGQ